MNSSPDVDLAWAKSTDEVPTGLRGEGLYRAATKLLWRDGWPSPVEGAALEMPYSRKAVLGSNPNPSANQADFTPRR